MPADFRVQQGNVYPEGGRTGSFAFAYMFPEGIRMHAPAANKTKTSGRTYC